MTVASDEKARLGGSEPRAVWLEGVVARDRVDAVAEVAVAALREVGFAVAMNDDGTLDAAPGLEGLRGRGWDDPRWLELQQYVLAHPSVAALRDDASLVEALAALAGGPVDGSAGDIVRVAFPGQVHLATRPHQDGFYLPAPERLWTVWIPLVPCPLDLGPLAVVPDSHTGGLLPHDTRDLGVPELASVTPPALPLPEDGPWHARAMALGDALAFPCFTIHAALPNRTPRGVRLSIDLRFRRA